MLITNSLFGAACGSRVQEASGASGPSEASLSLIRRLRNSRSQWDNTRNIVLGELDEALRSELQAMSITELIEAYLAAPPKRPLSGQQLGSLGNTFKAVSHKAPAETSLGQLLTFDARDLASQDGVREHSINLLNKVLKAVLINKLESAS